jgi:transcriptional regulator with XRE-family HTH domain
MRKSLDAQLSKFLREKRRDLSYIQFSKKVGISATMIHKLENGDRHITLRKLETVMAKLKIKLGDIFPEEF